MKRSVIVSMVIGGLYLGSCCGCGDKDEAPAAHGDEHHETTETEHHEEEESTLAFDGVDKGAYTLYGHSDITPDDAATITEMFTEMESTGAFNRKVSVKIAEVCQKAGCWITFDDEKGGSIRVFFRDHFTIPIETPTGTEAILYGSLVMDTLDVAFQKHLLDDAKEAGEEVTQAEYDAITEDKIEVTFDCESVLVKK